MTELTKLKLDDLVACPNIAELLDDDDLHKIGYDVVHEFETDLMSRSAWEKKTEQSMKLALQVAEAKAIATDKFANAKARKREKLNAVRRYFRSIAKATIKKIEEEEYYILFSFKEINKILEAIDQKAYIHIDEIIKNIESYENKEEPDKQEEKENEDS